LPQVGAVELAVNNKDRALYSVYSWWIKSAKMGLRESGCCEIAAADCSRFVSPKSINAA